MDAERLKQVEDIYHAALEVAEGERASYLVDACGADGELRREVESLLSFDETPENFIDGPPASLAAEIISGNEPSTDLIDRQIGTYVIRKHLGSGGMGVVFLADDLRLNRRVGLKLLHENIAADGQRRRRFELEARAASALNHPNILTIYEFGEVGGTFFLATELVEGDTLRDLISRGALSLADAVDIAEQTALALAAAHKSGIVHRDIKPENIMRRQDGIVKILDFGLAKLTEAPQPISGDAPQKDKPTITIPGLIMGTAAYMSPEQTRGLADVDARTDIWSLGLVMYEMVSGRVPFTGDTTSDVIAAILREEPEPLSSFCPNVPAGLETIVRIALNKKREERYANIEEMLADVRHLKRELLNREKIDLSHDPIHNSGEGHSSISTEESYWTETEKARKRRSAPAAAAVATGSMPSLYRFRWAAITTILVLIAGLGAFGVTAYLNARSGAYLQKPLSTARISPFTTFPGVADQPAFSPDGERIAFTWDGGSGKNIDLYVKPIGAGTPLRLTTNTAIDVSPAWSPDGNSLAFVRRKEDENEIFIVPALGGTERKLGSAETGASTQICAECGLSWSPDGRSLAVADRLSQQERFGIFLLSADDGVRQRLTSPPENTADLIPAFSPDGQTLAFIRSIGFSSAEIFLTSTRGGEPRQLTQDGQRIHSLAWTSDGREIVFSSTRGGGFSLWRVAVTGGEPERVAGTGQNAYSPAISRQGGRLVYKVSFIDSDIWRVDGSAPGRRVPAAKLISSTRQDHSPQYSPDGKKVVFASDRSGSDELWICESDGSNQTRLTNFNGNDVGSPRWSPDSRQIVFDARPNGNADIYVVSPEGGTPTAIVSDTSHDVMASWSHDGLWVYFCSNRSGVFQIWKTPAGGGQAEQVTQEGGFEAFESPRGDLLYYTKGRGPGGIWQVPVAGGEEMQVNELAGAGYYRYWTVLNDGIYFASPSEWSRPAVSFFSFATRRVTQLGTVERDPLQGPPGLSASPDGRWILYAQADQSVSDIMLVENFH